MSTDLREAHAHIFQLGRSLSMADLGGCTSAEEMLETIATHADGLGPDEWVLAHSARPEAWQDPTWPTRAQLDQAGGGRPVVAWCFDYHALVASSSALELARIDASTKIESGVVDLNADGEPSGLLLELAANSLLLVSLQQGVSDSV